MDEPVDAIVEKWTRFERIALPRDLQDEVPGRLRAEVLTFEPRGAATYVTLRISYDPAEESTGPIRRIERLLAGFTAYLQQTRAS